MPVYRIGCAVFHEAWVEMVTNGEGAIAPVSIIVRSMDRPSLDRALASIAGQRLKPREIIVVAAAGRGHRELPATYDGIELRTIFPPEGQARLARANAANAGLVAAMSEWIGFLDDDDELLPNHLEALFPVAEKSWLQRKSAGRLTYALTQGVDEDGNNTDVYGRSFSRVRIWESTIMTIMSVLLHRSLINDGCKFDEGLDIHEDWDFWIQCAQKTDFNYVEKITSVWHGTLGDSGCGFGSNENSPRFVEGQQRVHAKWAAVREQTLAQLTQFTRDAVSANARGDMATAIKLCQIILRQDPENVNAANLLGMISLNRGDIVSARQLMTVAIANGPAHFGLFYNMGLIEEAQGNADKAADWYRKGLALNPAHEGLRRKLGPIPSNG